MVVRVRPQPLWKLFLGVVADLLILRGRRGECWCGSGASQTEPSISTRKALTSARKPRAATSGSREIQRSPKRARGPAFLSWIAPALPKRDPLLLGRLEIPSVQLTVMLREGVDTTSLRKAAGHLPSSALPGQAGNVVVLGHRDTFFRPLRGIAQGDPIRVKTRSGSFQYVVDLIQVVPPEQSLSFQEDMPAKSLTLITCFPFDYVGPAPRRFVVRARMLPN